MSFGERVRALRKQVGISQRDLADQSGIDFTYLSKIENDKVDPPSEKVIRRMAEALHTDPDHLTVFAGKVPSYVVEIFKDNPDAIDLLRRSFPGDLNSRGAFGKALGDRTTRSK